MYKLLAIDIDGTIISFKRPEISDKVKEAIEKARKKGTHVVLISGRNYKSMNRFLNYLGITEYGITINGTVVVDLSNEEKMFEVYLEESIAGGLTDLLERENIPYAVFAGLHVYAPRKHEKNLTVQVLKREKDNVRIYDDTEEFLATVKINKYSIMGAKEKLDEIAKVINEKYGDQVYVEYGLKGHVDVYPKGASKGIALIKLADKLNIPKEQVMAIGDSENDISMIKAAGLGIAMGNAPENVKKHADYVTKTIDEDGVAYAIEKFILSPTVDDV